jgi:hypothetical protein
MGFLSDIMRRHACSAVRVQPCLGSDVLRCDLLFVLDAILVCFAVGPILSASEGVQELTSISIQVV